MITSPQAPRSSQVEIVKFLRGVTHRIEEEARRGVSWGVRYINKTKTKTKRVEEKARKGVTFLIHFHIF